MQCLKHPLFLQMGSCARLQLNVKYAPCPCHFPRIDKGEFIPRRLAAINSLCANSLSYSAYPRKMAMITGQAGVLIGPLTATWTPPTDCNYALVNCATCSEGFRGQKCSSSDGGLFRDAQTCWPPTNTKILIPEPTQPFLGWGFYSPGLACPTGYTSACTALYGERPEWPIQFTLNPEETAVGCCPQYVHNDPQRVQMTENLEVVTSALISTAIRAYRMSARPQR